MSHIRERIRSRQSVNLHLSLQTETLSKLTRRYAKLILLVQAAEKRMESNNQSFTESLPSNADTEKVPLPVTLLNMAVILVVTVIVIYPAVIVINVIWQTRELHKKYFFFVANLLGTDIASITMQSIMQCLIMIIYLLGGNSNFVGTILKWSAIALRTVLHLMTVMLPITLAAERMIVIGFPYRHRSILTDKTAAGILAVMWGVSTILAIIITIVVPVDIIWPLGLVDWDVTYLPFIFFFRLASTVLIVIANVFLKYKINISNRKAKENERLGNQEEARRFEKLGKLSRAQSKSTITLLLAGGIDAIANMLIPFTYVVISLSVEPNAKVYVEQFVLHPLRSALLLSHPLVYGLYMKKIRDRLPRCTVCERQQNISHSRVISLQRVRTTTTM